MNHGFMKKHSPRSAPLAILLTIVCTVGFSALVQAEDAGILTAPRTLYAGTQASFTLTTLDSASRDPVERGVMVRLLAADGSQSLVLFEGNTDSNGRRHVQFQVPANWTGSHLLEAQVQGLAQSLEISTTIEKTPAILIETDKPIYKPSQTILGRIVLLDSALRPSEGEVEVTFHDAKGLRIGRQNLIADEYGVAPFSLVLANEVNFGTWKIRARSESAESIRDIRVEEYTLPRFDLLVDLPKDWALVDEIVQGTVKAKYFFGRDVDGEVSISAKRWVGVWQEYATAQGNLSQGEFDFNLPAVEFVSGTPDASGQGTVTLDVTVTDSTGHTQTSNQVLRIVEAPVVLSLVPASDVFKPGIPTTVSVQSKDPEGVPVDVAVQLIARFYSIDRTQLGQLQENVDTSNGIGQVTLSAPEETRYAELEATAAVGGRQTTVEISMGGAFSPSSSFLALSMLSSNPANVGETALFSVASTNGGTVFYEVYAGGRTILSDATEGNSFNFAITPEMLPSAKVVAYQISDNNEIVADTARFSVNLALSLSVDAGFNPNLVKPGDPVEVTLDAGTGSKTLLGVSIVDQSVLALGRSRLHLAEVFSELERRFLEPQVEVHEGEDPIDLLPFGPVGRPISSPGALDLIREAGLEIATSPGLLVPEGGVIDLFRDVVNLSPSPLGGGLGGSASEAPRLRQFFPETWTWEPTLLTDDEGIAKLTLTAPDNITGWKLSVMGTWPEAPAGTPGIVFGEAELTAFQDFFVEPDLPVSVVRGENFTARVSVFNYLDQEQSVKLTLEDAEGFELRGESELEVRVPANSATPVSFEIVPTEIGTFPLKLTAIADSAADAILRELKVIPEGVTSQQIRNGVIAAGETVNLEAIPPPEAVADSHTAFLNLSPSPVAQSMNGVADLLEMPYGCGEQNMIFLAPDIEILKYLREIGELAPEVRAEAEFFVNVGYQRQLTFQTTDGGFAAFGGEKGALWLTAFVLSTFSGAREVRDIDESVLDRAAAMLVSRQLEDGSFQTDDFLIHQEMDGGLENLVAMSAYVTNALTDYGDSSVTDSLNLAAGYLQNAVSQVWDDPYSLSIAAVALFKIDGFETTAEGVLDRLLEMAIAEGVGLHWEPYPVETTGYATMALLMAANGAGRPEAQATVEWLSTQRNALGGYGQSTQDTVVALRALFQAARKIHRDLDVELSLFQGEEELTRFNIDETNFDLLQQFQLPADGALFELRSSGTGSVGFQLAQRFNVPGDLLPPSRDMTLEVSYRADHIEVDDIVDVVVDLQYNGKKKRTGMVIVDIGIPTGFGAVMSSLKELTESELIQRAELAGRKVIFYIDGLNPGELHSFTFQIIALFPVRAEAAISTAYEYYDASIQAFDRQEALAVESRGPNIESVSSQTLPPGEQLIIKGSGFLAGAPLLKFGEFEVESFEILDDNTLLVTVPRLQPGSFSISLTTAEGTTTWTGEGREIVISPLVFYFPVYPSEENLFMGFGLANSSTSQAVVNFELFGQQNAGFSSLEKPAPITLEPGGQLAKLGREIFSDPSQPTRLAWVRATTDNPALAACSLLGNSDYLDGSGAMTKTARKLYFTRIRSKAEGDLSERAATFLSIANPSFGPVKLKLTLFSTADQSKATESAHTERILPAKGLLYERVADLFQDAGVIRSGYIEVEVLAGGSVVGFQLVEFSGGSSLIGLSPWEGNSLDSLYSAQVAETPDLHTSLKLINVGTASRRVTLTVMSAEGSVVGDSVTVDLGPGSQLEKDLFDLTTEEIVTGSLTVQTDGPGIIGDVLIQESAVSEFATAAPLQTQKARKTVSCQIANALGLFSGVALFYPGKGIAQVTLEAFTASGESAGQQNLTLTAGGSLARTLTELIPSTAAQVGGYLVVSSSEPLVVRQIFGDSELTYFSTVPPSVIE